MYYKLFTTSIDQHNNSFLITTALPILDQQLIALCAAYRLTVQQILRYTDDPSIFGLIAITIVHEDTSYTIISEIPHMKAAFESLVECGMTVTYINHLSRPLNDHDAALVLRKLQKDYRMSMIPVVDIVLPISSSSVVPLWTPSEKELLSDLTSFSPAFVTWSPELQAEIHEILIDAHDLIHKLEYLLTSQQLQPLQQLIDDLTRSSSSDTSISLMMNIISTMEILENDYLSITKQSETKNMLSNLSTEWDVIAVHNTHLKEKRLQSLHRHMGISPPSNFLHMLWTHGLHLQLLSKDMILLVRTMGTLGYHMIELIMRCMIFLSLLVAMMFVRKGWEYAVRLIGIGWWWCVRSALSLVKTSKTRWDIVLVAIGLLFVRYGYQFLLLNLWY